MKTVKYTYLGRVLKLCASNAVLMCVLRHSVAAVLVGVVVIRLLLISLLTLTPGLVIATFLLAVVTARLSLSRFVRAAQQSRVDAVGKVSHQHLIE